MLPGLPPMPASVFKPAFFFFFAGAAGLAFWSMRIANDAVRKGEVKAVDGFPDRMFGMPANWIISRALKKRAAQGDREAILVRRLQWIAIALFVLFFLWPKSM